MPRKCSRTRLFGSSAMVASLCLHLRQINLPPVAKSPTCAIYSPDYSRPRMCLENTMSNVRIAYETFQKAVPGSQAALLAMGKSTEESGLDKTIVELVKLRISQINNCAFCLQIHLNVSRKLGVPQEKLDLVATWHEAGIFSDKECAALAWAETLTRLADRGGADDPSPAVRRPSTQRGSDR